MHEVIRKIEVSSRGLPFLTLNIYALSSVVCSKWQCCCTELHLCLMSAFARVIGDRFNEASAVQRRCELPLEASASTNSCKLCSVIESLAMFLAGYVDGREERKLEELVERLSKLEAGVDGFLQTVETLISVNVRISISSAELAGIRLRLQYLREEREALRAQLADQADELEGYYDR